MISVRTLSVRDSRTSEVRTTGHTCNLRRCRDLRSVRHCRIAMAVKRRTKIVLRAFLRALVNGRRYPLCSATTTRLHKAPGVRGASRFDDVNAAKLARSLAPSLVFREKARGTRHPKGNEAAENWFESIAGRPLRKRLFPTLVSDSSYADLSLRNAGLLCGVLLRCRVNWIPCILRRLWDIDMTPEG